MDTAKVIRIYCITNTLNAKRYVGQTNASIRARWYKHTYLALQKKVNTRFYEAIRKYGKEAFDGGVLLQECSSQDEANAAEVHWIATLCTMNPTIGYNMMSGGVRIPGTKMDPEAIEKIRRSKLGKPLVARTRRTDEKHRPIVEAFRAGQSRKQLATEFNLPQPRIVKILLRWKRLHDPSLAVGPEHQYLSSGRSLQRNAEERNQRMVDMVTKEGKTRKQAAAELGVSYALVKNVLLRHRRRTWSVNNSTP